MAVGRPGPAWPLGAVSIGIPLPIILVLLLLGGLVIVSQQSALASLIYTVF